MNTHAELLKRLLPPVSYDSAGPNIAVELGAAGALLDTALVRAGDILRESDPRSVIESLSDWERVYGLPDPCMGPAQSFAPRRAALVAKVDGVGGLTKQYFIDLAAQLGYAITIDEFAPHSVISRVNHALYGTGVYWLWQVNAPATTSFMHSVIGPVSEPLAVIGNQLLECVLGRLKPAHTTLVFNYF